MKSEWLLKSSWSNVFSNLSDKQAGILTKAMYQFNSVTDIATEGIAAGIKDELVKAYFNIMSLELVEKTDTKKVVNRGLVQPLVNQLTANAVTAPKTFTGFWGSAANQINPDSQKILSDFCGQELTDDDLFEKFYSLFPASCFEKIPKVDLQKFKNSCKKLWNKLKENEDRLTAFIYLEEHKDNIKTRSPHHYLKYKDWETNRLEKKKNNNTNNNGVNNAKKEYETEPSWRKELQKRFG